MKKGLTLTTGTVRYHEPDAPRWFAEIRDGGGRTIYKDHADSPDAAVNELRKRAAKLRDKADAITALLDAQAVQIAPSGNEAETQARE